MRNAKRERERIGRKKMNKHILYIVSKKDNVEIRRGKNSIA